MRCSFEGTQTGKLYRLHANKGVFATPNLSHSMLGPLLHGKSIILVVEKLDLRHERESLLWLRVVNKDCMGWIAEYSYAQCPLELLGGE